MDQGHIFKLFDILFIIPPGRMFNGIEPRNTDQFQIAPIHVNHYIYYSTQIKSKTVRKQQNRFTYLQYSKKIYISRVISVNKLSSRCKRIVLYLHSLLKNKAFWRVLH